MLKQWSTTSRSGLLRTSLERKGLDIHNPHTHTFTLMRTPSLRHQQKLNMLRLAVVFVPTAPAHAVPAR